MLPRAHLTSHSSMSICGESVVSDHTIMVIWVIKTFFCIFLLCILTHLLSLFCFCWVLTVSDLYYAHPCIKCSLNISNFLEEISSLSHSIAFLYFLALFIKEGFLISPAILWNSAFGWVYFSLSPLLFTSLLFSTIWKASSDNHFSFLHFFFFGMVLVTAYHTMSRTSVHSYSGTV